MGIKRGEWKTESYDLASRGSPADQSRKYGPKAAPLPPDGMSNSAHKLQNKTATSEMASDTLQNVSGERREEILIRGTGSISDDTPSSSPLLVNSNSYKTLQSERKKWGMDKTANSLSSGAGSGSSFGVAGSDTVRQAPEVYSPLFQIANLQLPRDRITMNAWNRNFYVTHPLVKNCINLHATYPLGKLNIKCKDRKVEQFFKDMAEDIDLLNSVHEAALEFWQIGEVFPHAELDTSKGTWKNINILNPDYIHVKKSVVGGEVVMSMRPDAATQRLVTSNAPADIQLRKQLSPEIVYHIRKGNNIPLDNFHVSHLKMVSSPYDIRGTSLIVSIYKDLMLYDKLRESKFAQADNLVNPITLVKVGGTAEAEYHPTDLDLEKWRQTLEAAQYDKDFKIISHAGVSIERVGAAGSIIDISGDMNFIVDNILFGLMTPKAILTQEGASYGSASVGLEVLRQRYESFRNMIGNWLVKKIFAPISEIHEFYEYKDGDKKLIVPEVDWNQMVLFDLDNYIGMLQQMTQPGPQGEPPKASRATLYKSLGLNMDQENRQIRKEMIEDAIAIKEKQIIQGMAISALRALKEDEDIVEPTEEPLPGAPGSQDAGMPGGMGMPPMGGGGLGGPPMGGGLGGGMPPMGPDLGPPPGGDLGGGDLGGAPPAGDAGAPV